jgi:hypothetical protein
LAIPFKSIRFNPELSTWGLNIARVDLNNNEVSCWNPIPRTFSLTSLAFTGKILWDEPAPRTGLNYSVIPYGIAEVNQNLDANESTKHRLSAGGDAKIAQLGGKPTTQDRTGKITPGAEAENTYMTSLFDPGSYAQARIQILGDPDYLMREAANGINEVYKQFYQSDNFTINPNGGQVFIEIAFNEGVDYGATINGTNIIPNDNGTGVLTINDSIFFWDYPDSVKSGPNAIKGVSYQVRECESVFKGGKFTQTLQLNINEMPDAVDAAAEAATQRANSTTNQIAQGDVRTPNSQAGNTPTPGVNSNSSSANTGLAQDDVTGVDAAIQRNADADAKLATTSSNVNQLVPTGNAINTAVASGELEPGGSTQAGTANNGEEGGRETSNTNSTTPTDIRTGEAITANFNNALGGV